ncbi:hypothetical protein Landi51_13741 [Colletotrichum acutatum]
MDSWPSSLVDFLINEWAFKKIPPRIDKAVEETIKSAAGDPLRVFLLHGQFQGWVAYALNPPNDPAAYSPTELECIARSLSGISLHLSVKQALLQMESKRRHNAVTNVEERSRLNNQSSGDDLVHPEAVDRQTPHPKPPLSLSHRNDAKQDKQHKDPNIQQSEHQRPVFKQRQQELDQYVRFECASVSGLVRLFPQYTVESTAKILRDGLWYAEVDMTFPTNPLQQNHCEMVIRIASNTVEHIASLLFGLQIQLTGYGREQLLPSGARLCGELDAVMGDMEAAQVLFGAEVCDAVNQNVTRVDEVSQGQRRTRCIRMRIPPSVMRSAEITLQLDLEAGTRIKEKLYPNNLSTTREWHDHTLI